MNIFFILTKRILYKEDKRDACVLHLQNTLLFKNFTFFCSIILFLLRVVADSIYPLALFVKNKLPICQALDG